MKPIFFLSCVIFFLAVPASAYAADPGHPASAIGSGTFESGDYAFPQDLNISSNLSASNLNVSGSGYFGGILYSTNIYENGTSLYSKYMNFSVIFAGDVYGAFYNLQLVEDSVGSWEIQNASITYMDLASESVTNPKIAPSSVNATQLSSGVAGSGLNLSGGLNVNLSLGGGVDFSGNSLSLNRSCSIGEILKWSGSSWYCSSDESSGSSGNVTGAGSSGQIAVWSGSGYINGTETNTLSVNQSSWWDGYDSPSGWDLDSSNDLTTATSWSGDLSGTGSSPTIVAGAITNTKIAANSVNSSQIQDGSISNTKIAANAVNDSQLQSGTVTNTKIGAGAVNDTQLASNAVTEAKIADGAVTASKIGTGIVNNTQLNANIASSGLNFTSGTGIQVNLTEGGGIEFYANSLSLNHSCTNNQILKWSSGGYWYCSDDLNSGGSGNVSSPAITEGQLAVWVANGYLNGTAWTSMSHDSLSGAGAVDTIAEWQSGCTGCADSGDLASGAITNTKVADYAINDSQLWSGAVTNTKIDTAAVNDTQLASNSVTSAKIASGAITNTKIDVAAVNDTQMADGAVTNTKIGAGAVNNSQLVNSAVTVTAGTALTGGGSISLGSSGTINLNDTGVTNGVYGGATVSPYLNIDSQGRIISAANVTITGAAPTGNAGGDLTGNYPNPTIGPGNVTNAKIADGAITNTKIDTAAVNDTQLADGAVTNTKVAANTINDTQIQDGAVTNVKVGTGVINDTQLASNSVTSAKIASGAVTNTKIDAGAVNDTQLASNSVTSAKIEDAAVGNTKIAGSSVNESQIQDGSISNTKIAASTINDSQLQSGAVINTKIGAGAVNDTQLASNSVTSAKISDGAVTASKIGTGIVNNTQLNANIASSGLNFTSGTGLQVNLSEGGGISFNASSLSLNTSCASGQVLKWSAASAWYCADDNTSGNSGNVSSPAITEGQLAVWVANGYLNGTEASAISVNQSSWWDGYDSPSGWDLDSSNDLTTATSWSGDLSGTGSSPTIAGGAITNTKISANSVNSSQIQDGSIGNTKIAANVVNDSQLQSGSVTNTKIDTGAVNDTQLSSNSVTSAKISDGAVTNTKIGAGAVNNTQLASSAVTVTAGTALTGGGSISLGSSGTINLNDTGVTNGVYGGATVSPYLNIDSQGRIISAANVTISGVSPGGNAGGDLTGTYPNPTIGAGKVTNMYIAAGAVNDTQLADGAVTNTKVATGAINDTQLASNSVTSAKIEDEAVTNTKIAANAVNDSQLQSGAVTNTKIDTGAVNDTQLSSNAVTEAKIFSGAVTNTKIGTGVINDTQLASNAVTSAKIADGSITSSKIGTGIVNNTQLNANIASSGLNFTSGTGIQVNLSEGGGLSFNASSLSLNTSCASGQILKWSAASAWYCADDNTSGNSGNVSSPAITEGQLAVWVANGYLNGTAWTSMSHDSLSGAGAVDTIAEWQSGCTGCADSGDLASGAITNTKIDVAAVNDTQLASNSVTSAKISDGAVTNTKIGAGAVNDSQMDSSVSGLGLNLSSGLNINLTEGGGIEFYANALSMNRSCSTDQILKWSASGWYCANDLNYTASSPWTNDTEYIYPTSGYPAKVNISGNLSVGSVTLFVDTTQGRVGVGTASPPHALTVAGSISASTALYASGGTYYIEQTGMFKSSNILDNSTTGNVGINSTSPLSTLQIGNESDSSISYLQIDTNDGAPSSGDCDSNSERGRMVLDYQNNRTYVCNGQSRGWDYIDLTD